CIETLHWETAVSENVNNTPDMSLNDGFQS
ncbi:MAG: hypothetical protein FD149_2624, partial [Rhodospirillaceae bacterium]